MYDSPTATTPTRTLANPQPSGAPLVFLVRETHGDWLQVLLPVRPNGSSGWDVPAKVGAVNGTLLVTLSNALSMAASAADACQGATFTVYLVAS